MRRITHNKQLIVHQLQHRNSMVVRWSHMDHRNKSRQDGDRDAQMAPNDLAHRAALEYVHTDLLGSWSDLDLILTWPDPISDFEIDLWRSKSLCYKPVQRGEHDGFIFIFLFPYQKRH